MLSDRVEAETWTTPGDLVTQLASTAKPHPVATTPLLVGARSVVDSEISPQ